MKEWWPRLTVLLLLALVLGVPFVMRPSDETQAASGPRPRLVILSPHNEQIRYEFARAFNRWRLSQGKPAVEFDWRSSGGASDLRKQIIAEFSNAAAEGREDAGIGKDLLFGGGDFEHNILARGVTINRNGRDETIDVLTRLDIPEGLIEAAFPDATIGGTPLYHPQLKWVGVALSSFGIIYNRDVLDMIGRPHPDTWSDLAHPDYSGWVALGDPSHSGSVAVTYNVILRRLGWDEGWPTLRRVYANARYFTNSAGKVPVDVSAGEAAAGMCIDFYGRFQAGAIGGGRVDYIDPPMMTAITPDPICMLRGAPNRELAEEFVVWLLWPETQGLWQRKRGVFNGPERYELRRLPVRRDLYNADEMKDWTDDVEPFNIARPFPPAMPDFYRLVAPLTHAMAIDVHSDLKAAWRAINDPANAARRTEMLALFDAMPEELTLRWPDDELAAQWQTILDDPNHPRHAEAAATLKHFVGGIMQRYGGPDSGDRLLEDRLSWTHFFQNNYRRVVALARGK